MNLQPLELSALNIELNVGSRKENFPDNLLGEGVCLENQYFSARDIDPTNDPNQPGPDKYIMSSDKSHKLDRNHRAYSKKYGPGNLAVINAKLFPNPSTVGQFGDLKNIYGNHSDMITSIRWNQKDGTLAENFRIPM